MQDFRKLVVWQKAHQFTLRVYRETEGFPISEKFGLTSQVRRSSASIGANLAEGCGRGGNGELGRFIFIALGSATETHSHLLLAKDLKILNQQSFDEMECSIEKIKKMLWALRAKLTT